MKLAILSNINIDPLKNLFHKETDQIFLGGFNQWQSELLNINSALYEFKPKYVFIYLNIDVLKQSCNEIIDAVDFFINNNSSSNILISNFTNQPYSVNNYSKNIETESTKYNECISNFSIKRRNVYIFDFNRLITLYGYQNLFSDKYWYLGSIKFTNYTFKIIKNELINFINAIEGKTKKVLILDLDNTIWGGIVGEDGINNIKIGDNGISRVYADFQESILKLSQMGILLAICSKNNENDIEEVFKRNTNMKLKWDDFICKKINWNHKHENLMEIANELNLSPNSFVFIDDNPIERELVKTFIPEITTPDFPKDISMLNFWFINEVVYSYFPKIKLTQEDINKTEQYKRNIERDQLKNSINFEKFIEQLNINTDISINNQDHISRFAQLTQKTNQFNLSLHRYTETEVIELMNNDMNFIFTLSYKDKYGSEGITGCALIRVSDKIALLDTFLLSCRVLGRKVEFLFFDYIKNYLSNMGCGNINAIYNQKNNNQQVILFLSTAGFIKSNNNIYSLKINNGN